jgi:hypothetical protein
MDGEDDRLKAKCFVVAENGRCSPSSIGIGKGNIPSELVFEDLSKTRHKLEMDKG